jgi:hypothetical protein
LREAFASRASAAVTSASGASGRRLEGRRVDLEERLPRAHRLAFLEITLEEDPAHARAHFRLTGARGLRGVLELDSHRLRLHFQHGDLRRGHAAVAAAGRAARAAAASSAARRNAESRADRGACLRAHGKKSLLLMGLYSAAGKRATIYIHS